MNIEQLDTWLDDREKNKLISLLIFRVGLTRTRAEYFLRLWVYLLMKQQKEQLQYQIPLKKLQLPKGAVECTYREAAEIFYADKEKGSERSAGMMIDKMVDLKLIKKNFDGNSTYIEILPINSLLINSLFVSPVSSAAVQLEIDDFNPRCDAIPIANLIAENNSWMNRNLNAAPNRIARILRNWANQYSRGMRVLRRCDNLNPVGFYLLYPVASESEGNFFNPPSQSFYINSITATDPLKMANVGETNCQAIFIRIWTIDRSYFQEYCITFIEDVRETLIQIKQDFPNICDIYSLVIHPLYGDLTRALGFQKITKDPQSSIYWIYLPFDRCLSLDFKQVLKSSSEYEYF